MNDLQILTSNGHRSLMRSVRGGVALFGSGFIVGMIVALIFHALIYTVVIVAAIVIVLVAAARMALGHRRM